ncbi:dolichyldiphosphatase 1-like [Macrosteles quadrilineatus]|uniref:dolichyldiphosphatase 1-like n=1 Tax=Macrosteles quadrilineatus TaxID=74068 RepID=UPI0023E0C68D|nr:dolichyldiphosphatase 1-like [Macrosteles quadrilineatus]
MQKLYLQNNKQHNSDYAFTRGGGKQHCLGLRDSPYTFKSASRPGLAGPGRTCFTSGRPANDLPEGIDIHVQFFLQSMTVQSGTEGKPERTVFFVGTLLNELLNQLLKLAICEPRPMHRSAHTLYSEYGMPSAHAQFTWFFATYVIYFVFIRLHHMNNNTTLENVWKAVITVSCVSLAVVVSVARVYLQYHTWQQVVWGAVVGFLFGTIWFALTYLVLTPYFPIVVTWRISELLLLRDTTLIPNVLWFEYTNTRQEARARGRKLVSCKSQ